MINRGRCRLSAAIPVQYSTLTLDLVASSTVIDMLGLLTLNYKKFESWCGDPATFGAAEFQKLKDSGVNVFHPAVGFTAGNCYNESLYDVTGWNRLITAHPDYFLRVNGPWDLALAKSSGRIGIMIGLQNSSHFRKLDDIDRFYQMGQRVSQLTYYANRLGGAGGLSEYGAQVVERMNKVGMVVDVSHCADRTTLDAIAASKKPVLVTHSNCRALVPNSARCKTDEAIRKLAAKGGVMGFTMVRLFVNAGPKATIENVLDHIDHLTRLVGVEHAGIGTDVDLVGRGIKTDLDGIRYAKKIFDLTEGLVRRKYGREHIELILGGNFQRALSQIWTV
jgi:membrane dipeptidase